MTRKEEFIKQHKERMKREDQARVAKARGEQTPNQRRLFERMGMVLKVEKPESKPTDG